MQTETQFTLHDDEHILHLFEGERYAVKSATTNPATLTLYRCPIIFDVTLPIALYAKHHPTASVEIRADTDIPDTFNFVFIITEPEE